MTTKRMHESNVALVKAWEENRDKMIAIIQEREATIAQQRAEIARLEGELAELRERTRWRKYPDEKPVNDDTLPKDYCFHRWTGNEYEVYACAYWCKYEFDDREIYGEVTYNFWLGKFELYVNLEPINIVVLEWTTLPVPPEAEND